MQWAPDTQDIGSVDVSLPRPTSRTDTLVEMTAATFTANRPGAHSLGPSLPPPKKDQVLQNAELDSLVQEVKRLQQRLAAKHPVH